MLKHLRQLIDVDINKAALSSFLGGLNLSGGKDESSKIKRV
jgi:hypothetical protein